MLASVGLVVVVGVVLTWWLWRQADSLPELERAKAHAEAVRTGLTAAGGTAAILALLLAVRRQHSTEVGLNLQEQASSDSRHDASEKRITDLYSKAADQLGSDKAPVRLAGLYSLERLAHSNPEHQQTVVSVLCAYLRMPYSLPDAHGDYMDEDAKTEHERRVQEREVRLAAQRILTHRLRPGPELRQPVHTFWDGIDLDLTGATLIDFDLSGCLVKACKFERSVFSGLTLFRDATFNGQTDFKEAKFASDADFHGVTFNSRAGFNGARFELDAEFLGATFTEEVSFADVRFGKGVRFMLANFQKDVHFYSTVFVKSVTFAGVTCSGWAHFFSCTFEKFANFRGGTFGGRADFRAAKFNGDCHFVQASFHAGAEFSAATFVGKAEFCDAKFVGEVKFGDDFRNEPWGKFLGLDKNLEVPNPFSTLSGATFGRQANFAGATFSEAPGFDGAKARKAPEHHWPTAWRLAPSAANAAEGDDWSSLVPDSPSG